MRTPTRSCARHMIQPMVQSITPVLVSPPPHAKQPTHNEPGQRSISTCSRRCSRPRRPCSPRSTCRPWGSCRRRRRCRRTRRRTRPCRQSRESRCRWPAGSRTRLRGRCTRRRSSRACRRPEPAPLRRGGREGGAGRVGGHARGSHRGSVRTAARKPAHASAPLERSIIPRGESGQLLPSCSGCCWGRGLAWRGSRHASEARSVPLGGGVRVMRSSKVDM
jgi:hypothetical protein